MVSLLQCEFLKLKRSKMSIISILGAMVTPFMILVEIIKERSSNPNAVITFEGIFGQMNLYMILLFGLMVYTVFASYLFSREYTENTLKTILTIPLSKVSFFLSKFLTLFIWCIALSVLSWIFSLIVGWSFGASAFSAEVVIKSLNENIIGTCLLLLVLTPFIFVSIWTKGIVIPVIMAAATLMFNAALSNENLAALFPWSATYLFASGKIGKTGYSQSLSMFLVILTSVIGLTLCFWYIKKEDVK